MALSNQPYLPLFVQDFLTDEKLNECSAEAVGVYIKVMCLMHKSKTYGMILLKQKYKQNNQQVLDFASFFARTLPYSQDEICRALNELIAEDVLQIEGEYIMQKRMIKDNEISEKRAKSGSKGGSSSAKKTPKKDKIFAKAKSEANAEYEYVIVNEVEIANDIVTIVKYLNEKASTDFKPTTKSTVEVINARLREKYKVEDFKTVIDKKVKDWLHDKEMVQYIRPITLFGNKFESYLNQVEAIIDPPPGNEQTAKSTTAVNSHLNFMQKRHGSQTTDN